MTDADISGGTCRVLIVEDEVLVSMMMSDLVEDVGFEVTGVATKADEAFRLVDEQRPDIAIVDVTLNGDRGGVEVGAELSRRYGIGLIFMSGHGGVGDWPEIRELDPVAVLQKPCLPTQVMDALKAAAKGNRASNARLA